jgi:multicomponent Na+:H+ antiporter subunit D
VAQIGYLFLLFPLVETPLPGETVWNSPPMQGAVYHVFSHAFAKASMFLAAGNVLHFLGHDRIADLDGVEQHIPVTFYAFGLSGITLMGLPPSGGFIAKWLMLEAAWKGGHWVLALVLIGGGLLAAAYVFKVYKRAFIAKPMDVQNRPLPFYLEVIPLLLAVVSAALGVFAVPPLALLGR